MKIRARTGDRVRLKSNDHLGARGTVEAIEAGKLVVRLAGSEERLRVTPDDVTNFSLAARKAWVSMPRRRVGRPKGLRLCDRVSVTLRIDRDLWEQFRYYEDLDLIEDRTATINRWLREKLAEVRPEEQ